MRSTLSVTPTQYVRTPQTLCLYVQDPVWYLLLSLGCIKCFLFCLHTSSSLRLAHPSVGFCAPNTVRCDISSVPSLIEKNVRKTVPAWHSGPVALLALTSLRVACTSNAQRLGGAVAVPLKKNANFLCSVSEWSCFSVKEWQCGWQYFSVDRGHHLAPALALSGRGWMGMDAKMCLISRVCPNHLPICPVYNRMHCGFLAKNTVCTLCTVYAKYYMLCTWVWPKPTRMYTVFPYIPYTMGSRFTHQPY
jgi:hypothetical protein